MTAVQNVAMGLAVHGTVSARAADAAARHVLRLLGLGDRLDYLPGTLSGGQKQRVAVGRALIGNPDVIFADEPTAALDKDSGLDVARLLKRLALLFLAKASHSFQSRQTDGPSPKRQRGMLVTRACIVRVLVLVWVRDEAAAPLEANELCSSTLPAASLTKPLMVRRGGDLPRAGQATDFMRC